MDKNSTLLLDVGNLLFSDYNNDDIAEYEEKNRIITEAMNLMGYDGLNLSVNDLVPDIRFLRERCKDAQFPLISANTTISGLCDTDSVKKYRIREINGIRIGITGVMPAAPDENAEKGLQIQTVDPGTALRSLIPDLAAQTDFIIVLSGFNHKDTRDLISGIPDIDLGLCIESIRLPLPGDSDDTAGEERLAQVMNITTRGLEIGVVNIEKKSTGRVNIKNAEIISLDQKVESDETILELTGQFEKWEKEQSLKNQAAENEEKRRQAHENLIKNLELSPEEYFNQMNQQTQSEEVL